MTICIGIDLGTTNSCLAVFDEQTESARIVPNALGSNTTPSVVYFDENGTPTVGADALAQEKVDPTAVVKNVKRQIGREIIAATVHGKEYSPQEISALVLKKLVDDAVEFSGLDISETNVVISVPAYFDSYRVAATKQAATIAGLNVIGTVQEPVAAGLSYGVQADEGQVFLVFDLGGGTFDVSVIALEAKDGNSARKIKVICNFGDAHLGGHDYDGVIVDYLKQQFIEKTGYAGDFDAYAEASLNEAAENAKKSLTEREKVKVPLALCGEHITLELARTTFDERTAHLLTRAINLTRQAISNADEKGYRVGKILLCGGSTLMPQVQEALEREFNLPIEKSDPHLAVARGASLYTRLLIDDGGCCIPGPTVEVELVSTKTYGIRIKKNGELFVNNLLLKDTPLACGNEPLTASAVYNPESDGQTCVLNCIYESDSEEEYMPFKDQEPLVQGTFQFPSPRNKNDTLSTIFELNKEGILHVTMRDDRTSEIFELEADVSHALLSEQDLEKAKDRVSQITTVF